MDKVAWRNLPNCLKLSNGEAELIVTTDIGPRIVHFHAKDTRIDPDRLYRRGVLGLGWHVAKLPGLGDVQWGALFAALTDAGYRGAVCIEVEDRAYEGSLVDRQRALRQSKRFLEQFISR